MSFDRCFFDEQGAGNFFVGFPLRNQAQHFNLSISEFLRIFWSANFARQARSRLGRKLNLSSCSSLDRPAKLFSLGIFQKVPNRACPNRANHGPIFKHAG